MNDRLASELAAARQHLTIEWGEELSRSALKRNHRLRRRRRNLRLGLGAVGVGAIGVALLFVLFRPGPSAPKAPLRQAGAVEAPATEPPAASETKTPQVKERILADGSSWSPEAEGTVIEVQRNKPSRVALVLRRGQARIAVPRRPQRDFVVTVEEVAIRVAGSNFSVQRDHQGKVGVWVYEGDVQVGWPGGVDLLAAGRSAWYPPPAGEPLPAMTVTVDRRSVHRRRPRRRRPPSVAARPESEQKRPTTGPDDLLRAMDLARSRGNSAQAARLLRAFLRDHAEDSRTPVAAFTLGRVLLTRLGRPRQAARAFARARALAPAGSLAEDALAREVEAWARAGELQRARARAKTYLRLHPTGRRASSVRKHAGLE